MGPAQLDDDAALAHEVGIHPSNISHWRAGQRGPSAPTLRRVAEVLGIPYAELADPEGYEAAMSREFERRDRELVGAPPVSRSDLRSPFVTATAPQVIPIGGEAQLFSAAGAAEVLEGISSNPDSVGEEVPPSRFRDKLGPEPIGVLIEGESLAGVGVHEGMVAWINTTDRQYYRDNDFVLANVREKPGDDLKTVVKRLQLENGEYVLYSVKERGKPTPFRPEYMVLLARVVCFRERTAQPPAFLPR